VAVAYLWGRIEGKHGSDLPIYKILSPGRFLSVFSSEELTDDDQATIKALWADITGDRQLVLFKAEEEKS
jgi:hypothetical protein